MGKDWPWLLDKRSKQKQQQAPLDVPAEENKTTGSAHPATLTILGSKVSTCFRRAFMVFPVSTMAWWEEKSVILTEEFNKVINNHSTSKHQRTWWFKRTRLNHKRINMEAVEDSPPRWARSVTWEGGTKRTVKTSLLLRTTTVKTQMLQWWSFS